MPDHRMQIINTLACAPFLKHNKLRLLPLDDLGRDLRPNELRIRHTGETEHHTKRAITSALMPCTSATIVSSSRSRADTRSAKPLSIGSAIAAYEDTIDERRTLAVRQVTSLRPQLCTCTYFARYLLPNHYEGSRQQPLPPVGPPGKNNKHTNIAVSTPGSCRYLPSPTVATA